MAKDPTNTESPTAASLQALLDAANATIASLSAQATVQTAREKQILLKMSAGLTRSQAISVLDRQAQYDASPIAKSRAEKLARFITAQPKP